MRDRYCRYFEVEYTEMTQEMKEHVRAQYSSFSNDCKKEFNVFEDYSFENGEFIDYDGHAIPPRKKLYDWLLTLGWDATTPVLINICW